MTTAWTIPSRLNPATIRRPASLNSLPDLSDNIEIGSRPCSGSSALFISPGNFELWGQNSSGFLDDSRTHRHHSNISVSFLGSRIRRQYRSSFMLSDDQIIGVTRCETFQPEDAKADVRVSLSLQGPPNRLIVSGQHHSQSAPSLTPSSLEDNRDWARLMLTTDRPRDSELVGRIGSRNYFTNSESGAPYFHRRITPLQKEEEYVFLHASPVNTNTSLDEDFESQAAGGAKDGLTKTVNFTVLMRGTGSDAEPSTERVEKDTWPLLSRHQESRSSAVSPLGRISLSEKEPSFPIPESQSPCTQQISDYLPSTERSESIIHLKRTKSETSLSAQTPTSTVTLWLESLHPKSSAAPPLAAVKAGAEAGERSTPQVDNTLSLHTDFEEEEEEEEDYDKGTVRVGKEGETPTVVLPTVHRAAAPRSRSSDETASASSIPLVSPTNGVVAPFKDVGGQECGSRRHSQIPIKSTILYTSLQMNKPPILQTDTKSIPSVPDEMQAGTVDVESEGGNAGSLEDFGGTEPNSIPPLPRKRKRAFQQDGEEAEDASQTDESQTATGTSTQVSEQDYYAGGSEQSVDSTPRLPPRPEKRSIQRGGSLPASHRSDCSNPKVVPRHGENTKPNHNVKELVIQPDDALSHGTLFRSPFDPRSEEDLVSSTCGGNENGVASGFGRHRRRNRRGCPEDGSGPESSFNDVKLSTGFGRRLREHWDGKETNSLNAYDVGPLPAPRHSRQQGDQVDKEPPRLVFVMNALKEMEEEEDGDGDGDDDDDDGSWVDEESRLCPPALPINLEAALAELPTEDPAMRTKRLRPLQYPLYVNVADDQDGSGEDVYDQTKSYGDVRPSRTMDKSIPEEELPDTLLIRTRRRTMSGVTGFLPRSSTLSSSSIWFGDHPVPTKTQIYAAEQSPLRLSSIQLQAQAEIARRRSRNNLAARSLISIADGRSGGTRRSRSLERSRTLGPSASGLYGPTGRRVHGGAPIVERAIKRHASRRDGYETLSLVHVPRLEEDPSSVLSTTAVEQRKLRRPASSASMARNWTSTGTLQVNGIRSLDKARSLIAQAAVDLAVHTHDASEV